MSSIPHVAAQNRLSFNSNNDMSSSSAYSLQLPYLGAISLGKSPANLTSFQKPLRELYIPYYRQRRERHNDERRIIISDRDILIFEPDAISKGKRGLIYAALESIVDIQALELYFMVNHGDNHHHKRVRAAFLPIGCEHQERFRSLYSTIDKSQYHILSTSTSSSSSSSCYHPPLLLFVIRKPGASGTCSLLDCHVFVVRRESIAFDLCDMIRKLIIKRTMSPILSSPSLSPILPPPSLAPTTTLLRIRDNGKDTSIEGGRTKYLNRDRPVSAMEHRQADIPMNCNKKTNHSGVNTILNDFIQTSSSGFSNGVTACPIYISGNNQYSSLYHDPSQVLKEDNGTHRAPSPHTTPIRTLSLKHSQPTQISITAPLQQQQQQQHHHHQQQRHFIKASSSSSSLMIDESDEVVNDLMNIVVAEKLKTVDANICQIQIKRHASFDHAPSANDHNSNSTNKKRQPPLQNHKKRSLLLHPNPLPTIPSANNTPVISRTSTTIDSQLQQPTSSVVDNYLLRPQVVINRYGDIGNYVPKLLRDNVTTASSKMRTSDSNENIFFRATNGHILNGFLNLDFTSKQQVVNRNNNNNNNYGLQYRSSPCLNEDIQDTNSLSSLMKQFRKPPPNQKVNEVDSSVSNQTNQADTSDDDHRVPCVRVPHAAHSSQHTKPTPAAIGGIKVLPYIPPASYSSQRPLKSSAAFASAKPRRVASFTVADTQLPVNYRQFLRHTDQGDHLYGEEQQHQQQHQQLQEQPTTTLEHSLGYFP